MSEHSDTHGIPMSASPSKLAAKHRLNVLLIEDNDGDARLIIEQMKGLVHVERAKVLEEAHNVANADVILLDLMLPGSLGVHTVKLCRAGFPSIPIVVLTHVDDARIQAECITAGADFYFRKGEQDSGTVLRAMEAAVAAFTIRTAQHGEIEATTRYVSKAAELLRHIQERLAAIK